MKCVLDCQLITLESASFREVMKRHPKAMDIPRKYAHAFLDALAEDVTESDRCGDLQVPLLSSPGVVAIFGDEGGYADGLQSTSSMPFSSGIKTVRDTSSWCGGFWKAVGNVQITMNVHTSR
eukprot:gnl/TRDRNA2_/TRDRNA2_175590_c1_seq5.p1 gnl/TRDRNA2_/TRDRNA2_175590_c1~~gnl/TRDRNA2_/TRDRNA2_175590_c1_seq5.p1  ORF type:complete len:122 (+),score=9.41 gnl/TRDRNA2_/TRDRNA2_175590_c1_seq5:251-616(+)